MRRTTRALGVIAALGSVAAAALDAGCGSRTGLLLEGTGGGGGSGGSSGDDGDDGSSDSGDASDATMGRDSRTPPDSSQQGEGGVSPPPSCVAGGSGMTTCGMSKNESCCANTEVIGGTFFRTYGNVDIDSGGSAPESDPATVSTFRLDKYEVTVGRFRNFVQAWNGGSGFVPAPGSGKHTHLNGGQGLVNSGTPGAFETGWLATDDSNIAPTNSSLACDPASMSYATWTGEPGMNENLPVNCANWWEAYAFCIYDGGFLPSETEWEYAAAGGSRQYEYPWGSADPGSDNQYGIYGCNYPGSGTCVYGQSIAPVGTPSLGAGVWGQFDLAGNVWEWNLDWFSNYVDPCTDCAYLTMPEIPTEPPYRMIRGGAFDFNVEFLTGPYRDENSPAGRDDHGGFRCARPPFGSAGDP